MIKYISKKFYKIDKDDLYQAGYLGLIKAYKNYNGEIGNFSSYAYNYIFGEMYNLVLMNGNIKINKDILKLYKKINDANNHLMQLYGREISRSDLSKFLEIDESIIDYVYTICEDMVNVEDVSNIVKIRDLDDNIMFDDILYNLNPLEKSIMNYRYRYDYTQSEVGKILGLTQVKVSRIESICKKKILEYIS